MRYGGYHQLLSYRKAELIYDATVFFCGRFLGKSHRTQEQMTQANYLLDQQIRSLEKAFVKEGGLRERMTRARLEERDKQRRRPPDD